MPLVQARGLRKSFGDKVAVQDLSFDVQPGSVTGFLGPNGAGKSTTMRLMLGLDNGVGQTTYDGVPYRELRDPLRHVGTVLEAKPFHPTRKAVNHLRMLAVSNDIPARRAWEVIDLVGLGQVARAKPKTFSLGMSQRLGLAAALLGDPATLILDEPANGLDPQGVHWLRNLLQSLAREGRSVFVSSHLLSEMALLADNLVVIGRGQLLASGKMADFVSASRRNSVAIRVDRPEAMVHKLQERRMQVTAEGDGRLIVAGADPVDLGNLAYELGLRVHELSGRQATLEEAFLEATGASEEFRASMGLGQQDPHQAGPPTNPPMGPAMGNGPGGLQ